MATSRNRLKNKKQKPMVEPSTRTTDLGSTHCAVDPSTVAVDPHATTVKYQAVQSTLSSAETLSACLDAGEVPQGAHKERER